MEFQKFGAQATDEGAPDASMKMMQSMMMLLQVMIILPKARWKQRLPAEDNAANYDA